MNLKCKACKKAIELANPSGPSPGGVIQALCLHCGTTVEVDNPHGDETLTFIEKTWLRPIVEKVAGALARDGSGPAQVAVISGYELAGDGEVGAVEFMPGQAIQRRLAPAELFKKEGAK